MLGDGDASTASTVVLPQPGTTGADAFAALRGRDGDQVAVLSSELFPDWDPAQGVALSVPTADDDDLRVLVADPALAAGGPEPGDPTARCRCASGCWPRPR